jgi:predicted nucleic acid-binding protein
MPTVAIAAAAPGGYAKPLWSWYRAASDHPVPARILDEIEDKLRHKLRIPRAIIAEYTKILESNAQILTPEVIDSTACRDPDDLMVLGVALGGRADVIITGDKDLLTLKSFNGIQIVTPRMFWETNQKQE